MKPKVGQYFYMPRGRSFRIYCYKSVSESTTIASPVDSEPIYHSREEARRRVYELNGWRMKK